VRLSVQAGADAAYLRRAAGDILRAATLENGRTEWRLEASRLAAAPDPLLSRALVQAWAWGAPRGTPPPGAEWVEGAMEFLRGGRGGRVACPGGGSMRRSRGVVEFTRVEHGPEVEDA
nr:hypothetical protein [Gemmatimonadota bacterium]